MKTNILFSLLLVLSACQQENTEMMLNPNSVSLEAQTYTGAGKIIV